MALDPSKEGKAGDLNSLEAVARWIATYDGEVSESEYKDTLQRMERAKESDPDDWWKWREEQRMSRGDYVYPGWAANHPRLSSSEAWRTASRSHFLHVSLSDPTRIAYTPDSKYGASDRQVVTTVGKYLTKYMPHILSEAEIKDIADEHRAAFGDTAVHFSFDADGIQKVYEDGPNSCMSGKWDERCAVPFEAPARIYDGPDVGIAYLMINGRITARTLVSLDPLNDDRLTYGRVYGDEAVLGHRLRRMGLVQNRGGIGNARLRLALATVKDREGFVCPYIDWVDGVTPIREEGILRCGDGHYNAQSTSGFMYFSGGEYGGGNFYCEDCEESGLAEDDGMWVEYGDRWVCQNCAENYVEAVVGVRNGRPSEYAWIYSESVIHVHDGLWVDTEEIAEALGWRYISNQDCWYQKKELVELHDSGELVPKEDATNVKGHDDDEFYAIEDCVIDLAGHYILRDEAVKGLNNKWWHEEEYKNEHPDEPEVELEESGEEARQAAAAKEKRA